MDIRGTCNEPRRRPLKVIYCKKERFYCAENFIAKCHNIDEHKRLVDKCIEWIEREF